MRFYNTGEIPKSTKGIWTKEEIEQELQYFQEFLQTDQFTQETSDPRKNLFEIVGKKVRGGKTLIMIH